MAEIPIPLLIKEKINSYLQEIYRQRWLANIKIMHQQYYEKTEKKVSFSNRYIAFYWKINEIQRRTITWISHPFELRKTNIYNFTKYDKRIEHIITIPVKYHYSSGLNHPLAFGEF